MAMPLLAAVRIRPSVAKTTMTTKPCGRPQISSSLATGMNMAAVMALETTGITLSSEWPAKSLMA